MKIMSEALITFGQAVDAVLRGEKVEYAVSSLLEYKPMTKNQTWGIEYVNTYLFRRAPVPAVPVFRPWATVDEVPVGKVVRNKKTGSRICIQSAAKGGGQFSQIIQVNGEDAATFLATHTMDDLSPCGVEIKP